MKLLSQEEVSVYWKVILACMQEGMPDTYIDDPKVDANLLAAIRSGAMQCWALLAVRDKQTDLAGLGTTRIGVEPYTGARWLTIYSFFAAEGIGQNSWRKAMHTIEAFARKMECDRIVAQTRNPHVIRIAESVGFETDWRILSKELEQ